MSYNKVYENKPIWHNDREPSINETRLNALSNATDIIDNRVIELDEKPLEDISNMQITDLQNGQGIKWNAELGKWENGIVGGNPRMTWANYQQAWERGEIEPLTVVTITDLSDSYINVVALKWQQYQALIEQELDDDNIFYVITDRSASLDLISTEISPTKAWSSEYTNDKFSAINSNLTELSNQFNSNYNQANTDFNKITKSGFYLSTSGSNRPVGGSWLILVVMQGYHDNSGTVLAQLCFEANGNSMWFRCNNGSTWSSWKKVSTV